VRKGITKTKRKSRNKKKSNKEDIGNDLIDTTNFARRSYTKGKEKDEDNLYII
jgi:hypothetical protein